MTTFIICLACYALGLVTVVCALYATIKLALDREWFGTAISIFLFFVGLAVFGASYASYEDGHRNAIRWNEDDLVLGKVYELYGEQKPFEFTSRSVLNDLPTTETRQLTWLMGEGEAKPFPFGLSQKLTGGKRFVFHSKKDGKIGFSVIPDSSSPVAEETVSPENSP